MTILTESVTRSLIDAALGGALLLTVVSALVFVMRRRLSSATRHLLWGLGLLSLLVVWAPSPASMRWRVSPPANDESGMELPTSGVISEAPPAVLADAVISRGSERVFAPDLDVAPIAHEQLPTFVAHAASLPWQLAFVVVWLIGVFFSLASYVASVLRTVALSRDAEPLTAGELVALGCSLNIHRTRMLRSTRVTMPMTAGCFRPVILLPVAFSSWPAGRRRDVLLHELAHVRRFDWLTRLVARIAVALHWFNPLAWIVERRLRLESERACDDAVLAGGGESLDYADSLMSVARELRAKRRPPAAAIAMAGGAHLERRLRAILDPTRRRGSVGRATGWAATGVTLATALSLGSLAIARTTRAASHREQATERITVAADGSGQYRSIQAAVDAAPEHAVVRVAPRAPTRSA